MRLIVRTWRESGAGAVGGPFTWWDALTREDQAIVVAEHNVLTRERNAARRER